MIHDSFLLTHCAARGGGSSGIDINPYSPGLSAQAVGVLDRPEVVATGEQAHSRLPDLLDLFPQSYVRKFSETFRDRAS